ncbi:uncharacterized protein LOC107265399 [Cephus cinctus]|uniref:Uncharacterized protein LOC107265399 n=1 Tax=Cephus cinctus TaxID=211228 RepID=A0AAJ7BNB3_CEPCN|nr:uncharacterized protein LOC107265399 [Cephus cinctus]
MNLRVLLLTLVSMCLAQDVVTGRFSRSPESHIQYSDPNGLKVNWKLYAPYTQWKSHLEKPQRAQRAETGTIHPTSNHQVQPIKNEVLQNKVEAEQVQYKPYFAVPTHIKELIVRAYKPHGAYIDPEAFIYKTHPQNLAPVYDQSAVAQSQSSQTHQDDIKQSAAYKPKAQEYIIFGGKIEKQEKNDNAQNHQEAKVPYSSLMSAPQPVVSMAHLDYSKNMPVEIQRLLHYQAQLPYNVIANHILYQPKSIFIPKPLAEQEKGPYQYRSKVYVLKNNQADVDPSVKPIEKKQRQ